MTSIVPGSATLTIDQRPVIKNPAIGMGDVGFESTGLLLSGQVGLQGAAKDSPAGYSAGFIQLQFVETNWAYYRGHSNTDGSAFLQVGHPPARLRQACRDTLDFPRAQSVNDVFYGPPGLSQVGGLQVKFQDSAQAGPFPLVLRPSHRDFPSERKQLVHANTKTGKPNYLQAAQLEFHFCILLAVRNPGGRFEILKHLYWNVRWQATFQVQDLAHALQSPAAWSMPQIVPGGTGATVSPVHNGSPKDARFSNVVTTPQAGNCNAVAGAAERNVVTRESNLWQNFDVRI